MSDEARGNGTGNRVMMGLAAAAGLGLLLLAERRQRLRRPPAANEGRRGERLVTNLVMAGLTTAVSELALGPVVEPLTRRAVRRRTGITQRLPLPAWAQDAIAVVLLDYTLYWWHVTEHRVPWLYRLHQVHHADLELDVSTAARFHFGEFVASIPWRAGQVVLIGASPRALRVWRQLTMLSVLFHHSNVRLPLALERLLARVVMTPRLHGIHHSIVLEEQDSNWSSGLTLWDRLHGTLRDDVPQDEITIGVPAYRTPDDVALAPSLAMPVHPLPPWRLPNGDAPIRRAATDGAAAQPPASAPQIASRRASRPHRDR